MATTNDLNDLYVKKIKSSGITDKTAKLLKLEALAAAEIRRLELPSYMGMKIPYFGLDGKPTKFFRVRYLEDTNKGFKKLTNAKALRYIQQEGTLNELYLPPLLDWAKIAADPKRPIILTEGEFKAAAGCQAGFATIGLGGVWCWRSAAHGLQMLPMFDQFVWEDRQVVIVYDSDAATNPKVISAENALADALLCKGAAVRIGRLAPLPNCPKVGLDDLLVLAGKEALREVLDKASSFEASKSLFQLNEEVAYVRDPGLIIRFDNLQRMAPRAFVEHAYSTRIYTEVTVVETDKGSKTKFTEKSAAKEWLKWKNRLEVERVVYKPGQERMADGNLNVWPGWGIEPKHGNVKPFLEFLRYIFRKDERAINWFLQWAAYPLQHPGVKLYSSCVIWGIKHGTGKSSLGYMLKRIYGLNGTEIKNADLHGSFNGWAENRQFVMGDEITTGDKRGMADWLKSMITQETLWVNQKHVQTYPIDDCINYFFTSNHPDSFFLEDDDRRYFIWEVRGEPMDDKFYTELRKWFDDGGDGALFDYLLDYDLTGFNPAGHALMTDSKKDMIRSGKSDLADWVAMLKEDPDTVLRIDDKVFSHALWRSEDLLKMYDPGGEKRVTANGMSRELRRSGFAQVNDGHSCRTTMGQARLWAIRVHEKFLDATGDELGAWYEEERGIRKFDKKKFAKR